MSIRNAAKTIFKTTVDAAEINVKKMMKSPITAPFDILSGSIFGGAMAGVSGFGRGLIGAKSGISATNIFTAVPQALGFAAGKAGVAVTKPIINVAAYLTKNTPKQTMRVADLAGRAGTGLFHMGFKKSTNAGLHSIGGYEARAGLGLAVGAVAVGVGLANGVERYDRKLALRSATNGMMDTEGVAITPGSANATYTPVSGKRRKVKDFGATGEIGLAAHANRQG